MHVGLVPRVNEMEHLIAYMLTQVLLMPFTKCVTFWIVFVAYLPFLGVRP